MQYKTLALGLLEQQPKLADRLRRRRLLLAATERLARHLKARHEALKDQLCRTRPDSSDHQLSSEAMEIALQEVTDRLHGASLPSEDEVLSLDEAMAFLLNPTPNA
jgi:hypothetical protein